VAAVDPAAGSPQAEPSASLLQTARALLGELPGLVSDRVDLLSLELKRAGRALAQIVALVIAAAILGVTLWLVLWGALVALLVVEWGWHWAPVLIGVALLNGLAVMGALRRVRTLAPLLALPATQRHLTISEAPAKPPTATTKPEFNRT
jgi:MFS family permease